MTEVTYIKRTVLLTQRQIEIVEKLCAAHDREFSAQVRVIINKAGEEHQAREPVAAKR